MTLSAKRSSRWWAISFTEYRWKKLLAEGAIEGTEWKPAEPVPGASVSGCLTGGDRVQEKGDSGHTADQGVNMNSSSSPTKFTTGGSPTTAGCRNCPIDDAAYLGQRRRDEREDGQRDWRQAG